MKHQSIILKVFIALILGVLTGLIFPQYAKELRLLSDIFIKLIKMVVPPIIFCTIVSGFATHNNMKDAGSVGLKALLYFEITSTIALLCGLLFANIIKPGIGINLGDLNTVSITNYTAAAQNLSVTEHLMNIIPSSSLSGFVNGDLLQVLFVSILFGCAILFLDDKTKVSLCTLIENFNKIFFQILHFIMLLSPFAVFGAIAYTVATFGSNMIMNLLLVIVTVYITALFFVFVILGSICFLYNINLLRTLYLIKEEIFITFGTTSSEAVMPSIIEKLIRKGHDKEVVGLVIPSGYSFNLDGTAIYLSIAILFIAQAFGINLSLYEQLSILLLLLITSKGAAAVSGGGFVTLAATLSASNILPVEGLALVIGVDRFMAEARSVTNLIGNTIATVIIDNSMKPSKF